MKDALEECCSFSSYKIIQRNLKAYFIIKTEEWHSLEISENQKFRTLNFGVIFPSPLIRIIVQVLTNRKVYYDGKIQQEVDKHFFLQISSPFNGV